MPACILRLMLLFCFTGSVTIVSAQNVEINVRDYTSLQAAIDAIPAAGGIVYFPPGDYAINSSLRLTTGDVTLRGAGASTVLRNAGRTGNPTIVIDGGTREHTRKNPEDALWRVQIKDMRFTGENQIGSAIVAKNINEIFLHNLWIDHHGGTGILLDECYENPRISDNNISYNAVAGVKVDACHDIVISGNEFEENGIGIHAANGFNATVTGNNIDDHIGVAVQFDNTRGSIISANMIENGQVEHLVLDGRSDGVTVSGNMFRQNRSKSQIHLKSANVVDIASNTFEGCGDWAIDVEPGNSNIAISGNTFGQVQLLNKPPLRPMDLMYGVRMNGAETVAITGNTMVETQAQGIYVSGSRYVTITGNSIVRPSKNTDEHHAGMLLDSIRDCLISSNIVIDDRSVPEMTYGLQMTGDSRDNIVTNNRIGKGRDGGLDISGRDNNVDDNMVR